MTPILQGIQNLSHGKASHLEEQGELAEINAGLNRAADYMKKKDNTRAEWIRGVSHDIRTPLSMVLGYASELEDDRNLPPNARKQAGIIRRESEKMKRLIDDLNLTTKLEYALQPVHFKDVDWVETSRQAVSEVLNSGLDSRYEIVFAEMQPGRTIHLWGTRACCGVCWIICSVTVSPTIHKDAGSPFLSEKKMGAAFARFQITEWESHRNV